MKIQQHRVVQRYQYIGESTGSVTKVQSSQQTWTDRLDVSDPSVAGPLSLF